MELAVVVVALDVVVMELAVIVMELALIIMELAVVVMELVKRFHALLGKPKIHQNYQIHSNTTL
jgi:hypothetical protein